MPCLGRDLLRLRLRGAGGRVALAFRALGLLRGLTVGRRLGAEGPTGSAETAGHLLHDLACILEPVEKLVDLGDGHTGAAGYTRLAGRLEDARVMPLGRSHRPDDRHDPVDVAIVDLGKLLLHLPHAGQHPEQVGDRPHLADGEHLVEEVGEGELRGGHLRRHLLGLIGLERLFGLLDEGEDVAHPQDARGHPLGVEDVEVLQRLTGGGEHNRTTGQVRDRQCGTAARVTVELGEHHPGEAHTVGECLRRGDGVLTDHGVDDEQDLVRRGHVTDGGGLAHHVGIHAETARGVDDDHVVQAASGVFHRVTGDCDRVTHAVAGFGRVHLHTGPTGHNLKLRDRVRTLKVGGDEKRGVALGLEPPAELAGQRRLARSLQARQEDDGGRRLGEPQGGRPTTQDRDQLLVDDLYDLLGGIQRGRDLLAPGPLTNGGDEGTDHRQGDVGLQQRHPDLPGGGIDVGLGQPSLATK